jgi:hypothetical protein
MLIVTIVEKKILEATFATVYYTEEKSLGKIVWHGVPTSEDYKKPFLALIDLAKKGHSVTRFLSDIRKQGVVSPDSRKWFEKEMVPAAVENGLKRAAVVSGSNAFKMYYINLILSTVNKFNLPFKIFNDEGKAIDFLMQE